ncbi:fumarylacetoacetate hydrolase family protein [Roseococcus suduntuyensis]|uniref:2-keto-4-pentenoate hydratase/2-oxohepta-3-ene-1,7-dioic acid hydratase in catechol pathway n=1 Tax=Roseococcus suduntuyensis TaxID=455361 RepID=A0A840A9S0_9PROT|nr:fumarylacetoacetate hydrolase family protein [Roseococcus suduntuyensis]MBB3897054.1 2-keto-4-pentenoate hydratase/2-oxohepta-3-ene-1,7-dioic acid hydratase in catechol pathway [Roseococcus suduntuyensis]
MALRLVTFAPHGAPLGGGPARAGALLNDGEVLDFAAAGLPYAEMTQVIEGGAEALSAIRAAMAAPAATARLPLSEVTLCAPIPRPARNVFCVGRNYMDHVAEGDRTRGITNSELPKFPQFFTKAPDTVIAHGATIPDHGATGITKWLDYEAELTIVVGTAGTNIAPEDALKHIFGWTIANDVTGRDLQRRYGQWFKGKSLDGSCPMGPWIIPADELDASDIAIQLWVNDEMRQSSRTSKMIFDVGQIMHHLSLGFTLRPGDLIMTGTPEGVGYAMDPPQVLKTGDVVKIAVEGIGELVNPVG